VQVLYIPEQVELLFQLGDAGLASSSEEVGSSLPSRLTRTEGICPIGVSNVDGWQPAGSFE